MQLMPRYQNLFSEWVESQLNGCFAEYLNAEIVLRTILDTSMALRWLKSTFLYVRVRTQSRAESASGGGLNTTLHSVLTRFKAMQILQLSESDNEMQAHRNPQQYGLLTNATSSDVDLQLQQKLVVCNIDRLAQHGLVLSTSPASI